jgi:phosphohistidine phosphatase
VEIYLIRHAIAAEREDWNKPDELRPLTPQGEKKMQRIARGLRALNVEFSRLYSSPLVRATQTAEVVRKALRINSIEQTDAMLPEASPQALLSVLNELPADAIVGFVGHEPHLGYLLSFLLSGQRAPFAAFKKGGVACLEGEKPAEAGKFALRWMLEPNHLVAIGDNR